MSHDSTATISGSKHSPEWVAQLTIEDLEANTETIFARLRREFPLAWVPAIGAWIATSWQVCHSIAADAETFHGGTSPVHDRVFGSPHVLGAEGELHADLRSVLDVPLRPRAFRAQIENSIRPTARRYVEAIRSRGRAELMADYFEPISVRSVADAFGFTDVHEDVLRRWFHSLASGLVNTAVDADGEFANPAGFADADVARTEIRSYLERLSEKERAAPGETSASALLRSGMPGDEIRSIDYLLPSLLIILLGGLQEPGHACGSTFLGLSTQPEQLRRVTENPTLIPRAITEGLRWLSPLYSGSARVPSRDVEFAGMRLSKGDTIWLSYGSANHDMEQLGDEASRFDLDRPAHPHLAFGSGRHACAGSAFAPQVARVALEELFAAFPTIEPDPEHDVTVWGWIFRGARELRVRWELPGG